MTPEAFRDSHPHVFFLEPGDPAGLESYLRRLGVLHEAESVRSVCKAGEGNMNLTLRVRTDQRSLIVKQSRPWVERFPTIAAPWDRVLGEARFYFLTSAHESVCDRLPSLVEVDPDSRVMVLADLGEASDYTRLYRGEKLGPADARALAGWLGSLHGITFHDRSRASLPAREMRRLNHEHLFTVPLDPGNGLDLDAITPGLRDLADGLATDREYVDRVTALGRRYLEPGRSLLHGDFFPGSWLETADGPAVIDPEFAFFGATEFDLGVFLAHLYLSEQDEATHTAAIEGYSAADGFDWREALRFAGVEIMRRLLGVAQLPLRTDLEGRRRLLALSRDLVLADDLAGSDGVLGVETLRGAVVSSL